MLHVSIFFYYIFNIFSKLFLIIISLRKGKKKFLEFSHRSKERHKLGSLALVHYRVNKQLLDKVEHDIINYQNRGLWSRRLRQITQTRGFDNSWYHAKTEFNNCFIIHFSHNSSSETEAKRSAILFLRRTLQGASNQEDVELDMINAISAADIAFIMSSSQAIVNWLNALDQSDFS